MGAREEFIVGQIVEFSDEWKNGSGKNCSITKNRKGVVFSFTRDDRCVKIKFKDRKGLHTYYYKFIKPVQTIP